jgi:hypothetical protein
MRGKGFNWSFWVLIILLAIVAFILIGFFLLSYDGDIPGETNNVLKPETVLADYEKYVGENITVAGYFYEIDTDDTFGYVNSKEIEEPIEQGDLEEDEFLLINYSLVNTIDVSANFRKYYFYGQVQEANFSIYPYDIIYLNVNKIEEVQ